MMYFLFIIDKKFVIGVWKKRLPEKKRIAFFNLFFSFTMASIVRNIFSWKNDSVFDHEKKACRKKGQQSLTFFSTHPFSLSHKNFFSKYLTPRVRTPASYSESQIFSFHYKKHFPMEKRFSQKKKRMSISFVFLVPSFLLYLSHNI